MGKFSLYKIPLRGLSDGIHEFEYKLSNEFFKLVADADADLQKGKVEVKLLVNRKSNMFELNFALAGEVFVPCDRCLDDVIIEVASDNKLIVKFGKEYSEESDEIVIIPEDDGEINIAWFLYEFVSLSIPMKHVHPPGKCNKMMSSKLNKHKAVSVEDDDDSDDSDMDEDIAVDDVDAEVSDPRWNKLKDLNIEE
ncbi:DUF177 domain-containing protein [Dysgonomonas sp. 216]|uniref:YceD family protein n=1 Tax=Dysgonomonas sp. 216 TaxID=2302934 RepID=UPI0013D095CC|nr:DUF177 domain-containing protein [Dysgonomonas sp. 216]